MRTILMHIACGRVELVEFEYRVKGTRTTCSATIYRLEEEDYIALDRNGSITMLQKGTAVVNGAANTSDSLSKNMPAPKPTFLSATDADHS